MTRPIYWLMIGLIAASSLLGRAVWAQEEAAHAIDAYDPADWTESAD